FARPERKTADVKAEGALVRNIELILNLCDQDGFIARAARQAFTVTTVQLLGPAGRQAPDLQLLADLVSNLHPDVGGRGYHARATQVNEAAHAARCSVRTRAADLRSTAASAEHVLVVSETRGYDLQRGSNAVNRVVSDLVKGNGRTFGYGPLTETDGDLLYYSFEGKVTTVAGPTGKPSVTAHGTWTSTGGTGKWKDRDARGTWKNGVVGPDTALAEWEGTWQPNK